MKIMINDKYINFNFSSNFESIYKERVGDFNKEEKAELCGKINNTIPHVKRDKKNRLTAYFTFYINDTLCTLVADIDKRKIVSIIKETHKRRNYETWNQNN